MAGMGNFNAAEMKKLQKKLNKIKATDMDLFLQSCSKELAARLLAKVIKRTPVGQYPSGSGKVGGTLRHGWTSKSYEEAQSGSNKNAVAWANSLTVKHTDDLYVIEIVNPVEYASYVEYGHRTRGGTGWVQGRFMLTMSEQELQNIAPKVLEAKINKLLKGLI